MKIATSTIVHREPVKPYETVVMAPAELEKDLVDRKVLQRYAGNSEQQPKGFVPDESIREKRRERRRQRQLKKTKEDDKKNSASDNKSAQEQENFTFDKDKKSVANPLFEVEKESDKKNSPNPLFREDDEESVPSPTKNLEKISSPVFVDV